MWKSQQQMACCPFNPTHVFAKQKFIFHLARCKQRIKKQHLYKKCIYNPLHFILKENIQQHEKYCPDRGDTHERMRRMRRNFLRVNQERQRSRQKDQANVKRQHCQLVKLEHMEYQTLEQCPECQQIMRNYKNELLKHANKKLRKYIMKYYQLYEHENKTDNIRQKHDIKK